MKQKLLLITALLFVSLIAIQPATAAPIPVFCIFSAQGNGTVYLPYLQYGQTWGVHAWACPAPGTFAKYPLTLALRWQSTCPNGGDTVTGISINGPNPYYPPNTIISVASSIYDHVTGRNLGIYDVEGIVYNVNGLWLPTWDPQDLYGPVPCDPEAHSNPPGTQSTPQ